MRERQVIYTEEHLDRRTGILAIREIGDYVTATEFGAARGVGPKKTKLVLHHLGLFGREGRWFRLTRVAVERGYGIRHDKSRSGYPFDVLSPKAITIIDEHWQQAIDELEAELAGDETILAAREALCRFKASRSTRMETQMEVRWLLHHFCSMTYRQIAAVLSVTEQLVGRYAYQVEGQRKRATDRKAYLPPRMPKSSVACSFLSDYVEQPPAMGNGFGRMSPSSDLLNSSLVFPH